MSLVGGFFLLIKKRLTHGLTLKLVSLAAGVLLATAFFDILPEAAEGNSLPFGFVFLGIVLVFLLERTLIWHHHHHDAHGVKSSVWLLTFGDAIHNFIDGIAIAAGFMTDYRLGLVTGVAVIAHEIPQEIADFSVYVANGLSIRRALLFNVFSATTALLGVVLAYAFAGSMQLPTKTILAFTGGVFIYIACSDLIPELHAHTKESKAWAHIVPFFLGIGLVYINGLLLESILGAH